MRFKSVWLMVLVFLTGCGGFAAENRLPRGSKAQPRSGSIPVFFSNRTGRLEAGTGLLVLADQENDAVGGRRRVVVAIQDGPHRGLAAQVNRSDLRP